MVRLGSDLVLVRPAAARRDHEPEGWLVTKDGDRWPCIDITSPYDILEACEGASVLWLDEPNIFEVDEDKVYEIVQTARRSMDVMVSGVPATSELEVFRESFSKIMAVADEIIWCRSDCDGCLSLDRATRSLYRHGEKREQVRVGGVEDYAATCPSCWNRKESLTFD
jgi:thymidine kinase